MGAFGSRYGRGLRLAAALALGAAACAGPSAVAPPSHPADVVVPPSDPAAASREEPALTRDQALARGLPLAQAWLEGPRYEDAEKRTAFLAERHLDEQALRRLIEPLVRGCLAEPDGQCAACQELNDDEKPAGNVTGALIGMLAAVADPSPRVGPGLRLLVRLDARGHWEAGAAVRRVLERRTIAASARCEPPSPAEIAAARAGLADFAVAAPAGARWPTAAELDDLAYLYAVVAGSGPGVGSAEEDLTADRLPDGHPALALRSGLRKEMRAALLDGDLHRHLRAAEAYLASLGYPGPLRLAEERDQRWGGSGASYAMREAARSAELIGRYDLAEALYRRALPGGGACGTTVHVRRDDQIAGVIRSAEQARGCRAAAAERLFGTQGFGASPYDQGRLARAGFDVPRLYAAALLTLGREDAGLERALRALPARATDAVARLGRMGNEAWAVRLRAMPGYADAAPGDALPRLLEIAEVGRTAARVEALGALGHVAEDSGFDPCIPSKLGHIHRTHMGGERVVRTVMSECRTRIDAARIDAAAVRIEALASAPEPTVREAVATALGRLATSRSRRVLVELTRDRHHEQDSTICNVGADGTQYCEPNRPVARAAVHALQQIAEADETRAQQQAARTK